VEAIRRKKQNYPANYSNKFNRHFQTMIDRCDSEELRANWRRAERQASRAERPGAPQCNQEPANSKELRDDSGDYGFEEIGMRGVDTYIKTRTASLMTATVINLKTRCPLNADDIPRGLSGKRRL
jgi:hypothetical protein